MRTREQEQRQRRYREDAVAEPQGFADAAVVETEFVRSTPAVAKKSQSTGGMFTEVEVMPSSDLLVCFLIKFVLVLAEMWGVPLMGNTGRRFSL